MPATRRFILATAGHVDHGKSAIVRALTGTDPDRLPEEKKRGITLDLGFAQLDLKFGDDTFRLGVIDVPGHEDFVHNMVAGVGSVDVALLVVAADDGWMPQTEEHLQILEYQGVTRAVVAVNKIDLATDRPAVSAVVRQNIRGTAMADAPIVCVSAVTGEGIDELKAALIELLRTASEPADIKKPRLHVDRTFTVAGAGTVVTGTLVGGSISRGQNVVVQPTGKPAKVRSVQSHNRDVPTAVPGSRVAINLPDLRVGERATVRRGDTITVAGLGQPSRAIDVVLQRSHRSQAKPLRSGSRVYVHVGTAAAAARVVLLDRKTLDAAGRSVAQLRFDSPVFVFQGDRLIVRDAAQRSTIAGGIVLDADVSTRRWTAPARAELLAARAAASQDVRVFASTEIRFREVCPCDAVLAQSNFSSAAIEAALAGQSKETTDTPARPNPRLIAVARRGGYWVDAAAWSARLATVAAFIGQTLEASPEKIGVSSVDLQQVLDKPELFEAMMSDLLENDFVRRGALIAPRSHHPALPQRLRAAGVRVRAGLAERPLEPPNRNELSANELDAAALRFLLDTGEAVALGDELVLSTEAIDTAAKIICRHITAHGPSTAAELKIAVGTTRRVIIPLLEYFDRHNVTRRDGDRRTCGRLP